MASEVINTSSQSFPYRRDGQFPRELSAAVQQIDSQTGGGSTPTPTPMPTDEDLWYAVNQGGDDDSDGVTIVTTDNDAHIDKEDGSFTIDQMRLQADRAGQSLTLSNEGQANEAGDVSFLLKTNNEKYASIALQNIEQPVYTSTAQPPKSLLAKIKEKLKPVPRAIEAPNADIPALVLSVPPEVGNIILDAANIYLKGDIKPIATNTVHGVLAVEVTGAESLPNVVGATYYQGKLTLQRGPAGGGGMTQVYHDGSLTGGGTSTTDQLKVVKATTTRLGGVIPDGSTILIDDNGKISATGGGGTGFGVVIDGDPDGPFLVKATKNNPFTTLTLTRGYINYTQQGSPGTGMVVTDVQWIKSASTNMWTLNVVYGPGGGGGGMTKVFHDNTLLGDGNSDTNQLKLNKATTTRLGGVIPDGSTITIDDSGKISATGGGGGGGGMNFEKDGEDGDYIANLTYDKTSNLLKAWWEKWPNNALTFSPNDIWLTHPYIPGPTESLIFTPTEIWLTHGSTPSPGGGINFDKVGVGNAIVDESYDGSTATLTVNKGVVFNDIIYEGSGPYVTNIVDMGGGVIKVLKKVSFFVDLSGDYGVQSVTGSGFYGEGDPVQVTGELKTGYNFKQWSENGEAVSLNRTYNFIMPNHDRDLLMETYNKSFAVSLGHEWGIMDVTGEGVYPYNSQVNINATLMGHYVFDGWYDGYEKVSGDANYIFTMPDHALYLIAQAVPEAKVTLTLTKDDGILSVSGAGQYFIGDVVTINCVVLTGRTFKGWYQGDFLVSADPQYTIPITGNDSFEARTDPPVYGIRRDSDDTFEVLIPTVDVAFPAIKASGVDVQNYTLMVSYDRGITWEYAPAGTTMHYDTVTMDPYQGGDVEGQDTDYLIITADFPDPDVSTTFSLLIYSPSTGSKAIKVMRNGTEVTSCRTFKQAWTFGTLMFLTLDRDEGVDNTAGGGAYERGTLVTASALMVPGRDFDGWYDESDSKVSGDLFYSFNISRNIKLTAKAKPAAPRYCLKLHQRNIFCEFDAAGDVLELGTVNLFSGVVTGSANWYVLEWKNGEWVDFTRGYMTMGYSFANPSARGTFTIQEDDVYIYANNLSSVQPGVDFYFNDVYLHDEDGTVLGYTQGVHARIALWNHD